MASPTPRDVKRLFALSGNRCAFPKCPAIIAEGTSLIGEICHIHADKPGGPRYDTSQTDAERQGFDNLLLMCANHHKVVDDDDVSYPAERLRQIKHEHESRQLAANENADANTVVQLLIDKSVSISAQDGGFAAQTVNAHTINLNQSGPIKNPKTEAAVDVLWTTLLKLKQEFSDVSLVDTILLPTELDACFRGTMSSSFYDAIRRYADNLYVAQKMQAIIPMDVERHRLYVSDRLWSLYQVLITLHGRSAMLLTTSHKDGKLHDWRNDAPLDGFLRQMLGPGLVDAVKGMQTGGLSALVGELENKFRREGAIL
jgi:hypothetical protein